MTLDTQPLAHPDGHQPIGRAAAALCILLAALWGATPVAISYSTDRLPPVAVSGIRFAMAAVFMLLWCQVEGSSLRLRHGQWGPSLLLGLMLFGQVSLFTLGVQESNSSHGSIFINTFIFWVAAIEHFIVRTMRLSWSAWLGLLLAGAGVGLILVMTDSNAAASSAARDQPSLKGDLILIGSAFLLGIKFIYTKVATRHVEPGKLIFWHDVFGVVLFAAYSLAFETTTADDFTTPVVLGLLYQGVVVAGFCFATQAYLLRRHSAAQLAVWSFATPLFGIALGVLFRGDAISPWLLVSGIAVAIGIALVNRPARTTPVAE